MNIWTIRTTGPDQWSRHPGPVQDHLSNSRTGLDHWSIGLVRTNGPLNGPGPSGALYPSLPAIHKASLSKAVAEVRDVAVAISDDLNVYLAIRPGGKLQLSKFKFGILQNPREAESRLTARLSILNTCMAAIIK